MRQFKLRPALAAAGAIAALATLSACATSVERRPHEAAPDPVIEVRVETRIVCPPELDQAVPDRPVQPAEATLDAGEATLRWIADRFSREALLEARLIDAKAACPQ